MARFCNIATLNIFIPSYANSQHTFFITPPANRATLEPFDKKLPETHINTGFRHFSPLFKLGVSFVVLNYICLGFMQIHAAFYFNYINYSGLLIFCCQNVATDMIKYFQSFVYKYPEIPNKPMKKHHPISDEFLSYAFLFFYL